MKQNYSVINFSLVSHILGGKPEATAAGIEQRPGVNPDRCDMTVTEK